MSLLCQESKFHVSEGLFPAKTPLPLLSLPTLGLCPVVSYSKRKRGRRGCGGCFTCPGTDLSQAVLGEPTITGKMTWFKHGHLGPIPLELIVPESPIHENSSSSSSSSRGLGAGRDNELELPRAERQGGRQAEGYSAPGGLILEARQPTVHLAILHFAS